MRGFSKNKFVLGKKSGYTIVELLVVMGIISVLMLLSFSGYLLMRRNLYLNYVTDLIKSDLRTSFIQAVSVREQTGTGVCAGKTPKIRAIKIPASADFTEYYIDSYCENNTGTGLVKEGEIIRPSEKLGFKENMRVNAANQVPLGVEPAEVGYNVITFSSPYGEGNVFYYDDNPDPPGSNDEFDQGLSVDGNFSDPTTKWGKKTDGSYFPVANLVDYFPMYGGEVSIQFILNSNSGYQKIIYLNQSGHYMRQEIL